MIRLGQLLLVALALAACWWGTALAGDGPGPDQPAVSISRSAPDLHLSVSDMPGESTLRLPFASENTRLYGLLSPYLSLGASTSPGMPWNSTLPSSLRNDPDGPQSDLRLGAGFALPLSDRAQIYGEYRFRRGRLDSGVGRGLLHREPDSADFRAGFAIPLHWRPAASVRANSSCAFCSSAGRATRASAVMASALAAATMPARAIGDLAHSANSRECPGTPSGEMRM